MGVVILNTEVCISTGHSLSNIKIPIILKMVFKYIKKIPKIKFRITALLKTKNGAY